MGFKYDSSVIPGIVPGRHYNIVTSKKPYYPSKNNIYKKDDNQKNIIELPLAVSKKLRLSINGLFMPYLFNIKRELKTIDPLITYIHLYDFIKIKGKGYIWDKFKREEKNKSIFEYFISKNINSDISLLNYLEFR